MVHRGWQRQKQIPPLRCGMTTKEQVQRQKQIPPLRYGMTTKQQMRRQGKSGSSARDEG
jgi:hypothetical protein